MTETQEPAPATQTTRLLHLEAIDSGVYQSRARRKPTCCGRWATSRELAAHRDLVTCPACRAALALWDAQEW